MTVNVNIFVQLLKHLFFQRSFQALSLPYLPYLPHFPHLPYPPYLPYLPYPPYLPHLPLPSPVILGLTDY
jgi:hypothetical protein